jgi:hypothetical protein
MHRVIFVLVMVGVFAGFAFANSTVSLTFSGLLPNEQVLGYYSGGFGSLGSGPGADYGISFSPNATIFSGAHGNVLTANGTLVMNVGTEFARGFRIAYAALTPATVNVWSGFDGSGVLLASLILSPRGWCHTLGCAWATSATGFYGTAASVTFSGTTNEFGIGDIELGIRHRVTVLPSGAALSRTETLATPEPSAFNLFALGIAAWLLTQLWRRKPAAVMARTAGVYLRQ